VTDIRAESRARWARGAAGWEAEAEAMRRTTMPVSAWMVEAVAPQPGQTVLELAAGPGDTGFLAAELLRPGGTLISSDLVPEMLSAAQRRAEALGLDNVRFRQIDAEQPLDLDAASVDGVLCRWGYMLMADPEAALRETRRVLRSGGRLALAAWTGPEENGWSAVPQRLLLERGLVEPPADPAGPGQFAWGREGAIAEHLDAAGFVEYDVDAVPFVQRYDSVEHWWRVMTRLSAAVRDVDEGIDAATRSALLEELAARGAQWADDEGALTIPAATWVAAATV
jgi:SAM-dependent methyltransferase